MQQELTCEQVGALMTFYIEDKLSKQLSLYVKHHLEICPACNEKYESLKKVVSKFVTLKREIKEDEKIDYQTPFIARQYEEFKTNLSAYVDNELNDIENMKMKKITISNPQARRDLEDIYTFKKLLHTSIDRTKNEIRNDYSKLILAQLQSKNKEQFPDPFVKIMAIFAAVISCVVFGIIGILYF